jgi:hypothetical protein
MSIASYLLGCIIPIDKGRVSSYPESSHQFTEEQVEEMAMEDEPF